ncbi:hypothetical protein [Micromonospora sp. DT227]|uniref:hypothetical protein n=1 Tax=Micromonospora sp. DT227 TaxID=3393433 RepID=UPI003CF03CFA
MVGSAGQRAFDSDEQVAASPIGSSHRVGMADLPLGPWAGAVVEAVVRKSGRVWHADPDCSQRPARVETSSYRQPDTGSLQDLVLPENLHCNPPGELGAYRRAANRLLEYDAETCGAEDRLAAGGLSLGLLDERLQHGDHDLEAVLASGELAAVWAVVRQRRNGLLVALRDAADSGSERLAVMVLADWVRSGRTRREHQPRYTEFLELAVERLERHRLAQGGADRQIANTWLPDWLVDVSTGTAPANATARLVGQVVGSADVRASHDVPAAVTKKVWTSVGRAWESLLTKLAGEYPGDIVAVFH